MIFKITDADIFKDNPELSQHPIFSKMEDKHLRYLAFVLDPWSPLRFMDDPAEKRRLVLSMVPGIEFDHTDDRPKDADIFLWDQAIEEFQKLCPAIELVESIEARRNYIKDLREEEAWSMPAKVTSVDLARHKARQSSIHQKILSKAIDELESMYGRLQYEPVIRTAEGEDSAPSQPGQPKRKSFHIDDVSFR